MISRRTFIGGCVAAGVGAGLPAPSGERVELFGPTITDYVGQPVTIPPGALIFSSSISDKATAKWLDGGYEYTAECDITSRSSNQAMFMFSVGNARLREVRKLPTVRSYFRHVAVWE